MEPNQTQESFPSNKYLVSIGIFVAIAILAFVLNASNTPKTPNIETTTQTETAPTTESVMATENYKDGTYEATGQYTSPGGPEKIIVSLTLEDGVIVDSTVTPQAVNPNTVKFQGIFTANYKPLVIGKRIDEVKLDKVSGSSLSPKGFNDAVQQIAAQAKQG